MNNCVTGTTTTANYTYCGNRLPCGLCRITMGYCPLAPITVTPTWTTTTASTSSGVRKDEVENG